MQRDFPVQFVAWCFVTAAALVWGGWVLMPVHIGTYFVPEDFAAVSDQFHLWIWLYRAHIFGLVITAIALVALGSLLTGTTARVMAWPGIGVATAGTFVTALAAAFYYHHGAWGALEMDGRSAAEIKTFIDSLLVDTEYVTCLTRFGRVFSGLGLMLLGIALAGWKLLPGWIGGGAVLIGLAAMALTMGLPDRLSLYLPIFHLHALWLVATGMVLLRSGLRIDS